MSPGLYGYRVQAQGTMTLQCAKGEGPHRVSAVRGYTHGARSGLGTHVCKPLFCPATVTSPVYTTCSLVGHRP